MRLARSITAHEVPGAASNITVTADERDPANGNASHKYLCQWQEPDGVACYIHVDFQHGPIKENAVNGITNEILIAMVMDRLEGFQAGKFACDENAEALASLTHALSLLQLRTANRVARGVEGKNLK
jgi:hypothetical protein